MDSITIGKIGEHLVCVDLMQKGFEAYIAEEGLPYDVLLDTGKKLLKVQVKTTKKYVKYKNQYNYHFVLRNTKQTQKRIDIYALVCLDTGNVGYIKNSKKNILANFKVDKFKGLYRYDKIIDRFNIVKELQKQGFTQVEIMEKTDISKTQVYQYFKEEKLKLKIKTTPYFSELIRNRDWFDSV